MEEHGPFVAPFDGSVDGVLKIGRTVVLDALAQADSMAVLIIVSPFLHDVIDDVPEELFADAAALFRMELEA